MAADINSFLSHFTGGGARGNRYEVLIGFPKFLNAGKDISQIISFTCKAASIPASTLGQAIVQYKGRQIKIAGDRVFDDWNVTILIDNNFIGRDIFEKWSNGILGNHSNVVNSDSELNPVKIYGQATVKQLDRTDKVIKSYQVTGIFPTSVAEVQLGYGDVDTVLEQQVTFAVNEWESYDLKGTKFTS